MSNGPIPLVFGSQRGLSTVTRQRGNGTDFPISVAVKMVMVGILAGRRQGAALSDFLAVLALQRCGRALVRARGVGGAAVVVRDV